LADGPGSYPEGLTLKCEPQTTCSTGSNPKAQSKTWAVIPPDDPGDLRHAVGLRQHDVRQHLGFRRHHVHVARKTSCHRMGGKAHLLALCASGV
jgi:hypothetical protein